MNHFKIVQPPHPLAGLTNRTSNCIFNNIGHYDEQGNLRPLRPEPKTKEEARERAFDWQGGRRHEWVDCADDANIKDRLLAMYHNGTLYEAARRQRSNDEVLAWRNFGRYCYIELCVWLGFPPLAKKRTLTVVCPHCHKPHNV